MTADSYFFISTALPKNYGQTPSAKGNYKEYVKRWLKKNGIKRGPGKNRSEFEILNPQNLKWDEQRLSEGVISPLFSDFGPSKGHFPIGTIQAAPAASTKKSYMIVPF